MSHTNSQMPHTDSKNMPSPSRRDFLKLSATVAAGTALAGVHVPHVHAAENNTIKLALVGCGGRGTGAVGDAFAASGGPIKLHAMADVFENRLTASLKHLAQHGNKADVPPERRFLGFDAYRKAIDCLAPGDVVILTTPSIFRPVHFEYAVEKGINVFMEKSFAVDAPGVRRLLKTAEASEKKGLKVGAGFMWRHSRARQEVIRRIHDGAIGDLHTLRIYRVHGPVHAPRLPKGANEMLFQIRNFASFNWTAGSFFVDWHCHNVDVACWAKGAWPVAAQGMGGRCHPAAGNLFDHYSVEYTFEDGAKLFAFSRHMANCWDEYADYAHGSKGSAVIMTNLSVANPRIYKGQKMTTENLLWKFGTKEPSPYEEEWRLLLEAIRQNKPHNESRRAAEADLAAIMGRMAAHSGAYVTWDQAMKSDVQYIQDVDHLTFDTPAPIHADADGSYAAPIPGISKEW